MSETLTISSAKPEATALDFEALREEGVKYLEEVVGKLWTDYNTHDPGITMLELLCYGITDIAYRTSFEDADLFAQLSSGTEVPFVTARHALTNEPVTINDYRRLILDAFPNELRNVWFSTTTEELHANTKEKVLTHDTSGDYIVDFDVRGLYHIRLLYQQALRNKPARRAEIEAEIASIYHQHRGLCEDLNGISRTGNHEIMVCADIQIAPEADIDLTYASIIKAIQDFLNPSIPRHSLSELVEQGYSSDEIFEGPALSNGFILEEDLDEPTTIRVVRTSDIIAAILDVEGVLAIPSIYLNEGRAEEELEAWELEIPGDLAPSLRQGNARLHLYKDLIPFDQNDEKVKNILADLHKETIEANELPTDEDFPIPEGSAPALDHFTTLQESLPAVYGCGSRGLNRNPDPVALAKAKQLQAFLLIFDQILANYLGQLSNLTSLFSAEDFLKQSFFANPVSDLPDLISLLKPQPEDEDSAVTQYVSSLEVATKSTDDWITNRSALFEHILARFGETFTDYVLMSYNGDGQVREPEELLDYKRTFLKELPIIAPNRGRAHDYTDSDEVWDTSNVSGLQHRVSRLLGFDSYDRRNLSTISYTKNVYQEEDDDDDDEEFRFNILEPVTEKVLLSGTTRYTSVEAAEEEMREAIRLGKSAAHYHHKVAKNGKHFFNVINEDGETVATRKQLFNTLEDAVAARDIVIAKISAAYSEEGMFVIEHLLLRPRGTDWNHLPAPCETNSTPESWDPYSFRLHIVLPGWGERLANPGFRHFVTRAIHSELPAHLSAKICFVSQEEMADFEICYRAWLENLASESPTHESLNALIDCLNELNTVYPSATLHDCAADGDEQNPIVLGHTIIGSNGKEHDHHHEPE